MRMVDQLSGLRVKEFEKTLDGETRALLDMMDITICVSNSYIDIFTGHTEFGELVTTKDALVNMPIGFFADNTIDRNEGASRYGARWIRKWVEAGCPVMHGGTDEWEQAKNWRDEIWKST